MTFAATPLWPGGFHRPEPKMAIEILEAGLERDEEALIGLVRAHLKVESAVSRFRWLYRDNPFGAARCWIAVDSANNEAVGMAAAFPRRMFVRGAEAPACVLGDFCVDGRYRSLGPAIKLQRACLAPLRSGEFSIGYDFPSTGMLSIYRRLGVAPNDAGVRMAKPLMAVKKLEAILPSKWAAHVLAVLPNLGLAFRDSTLPLSPNTEFRLERPPCTLEYSELARRVGSSLGACTVRTAEYLNWRYWGHPFTKYELLSARRGRELLGYCVFAVADSTATIVDLFGSRDDGTLVALVAQVVRLLRNRGVALVNTTFTGSSSALTGFRRLGFWPRESFPVVLLGLQWSPVGTDTWLTPGDRES